MDRRSQYLEARRQDLATEMGLDPDDRAVWRALALEEGALGVVASLDRAENTAGCDNGNGPQRSGRKQRTEKDTDT